MKPEYKNWVPKGMVNGFAAGTAAAGAALAVFGLAGIGVKGGARAAAGIVSGAAFVGLGAFTAMCIYWRHAFDFDRKGSVSNRIIDGVAKHITLPEGGTGLDIGCGSGALTIACAKCNPQGKMLGLDRWGREYASFSQTLCEHNAAAEGVSNTSFVRGDAVKLNFLDESFDAVTSNYVYHNIPSQDRQALLLESLRVLKKGGVFAIHDLMNVYRYGDMDAFVQKLYNMGYADVQLIDTANGLFMSRREARTLGLTGSALLVGRK